ncbi:uncharacterized protein LOC118469558 [Amphiprion ocellaris]|uniref:uncharacterized protein LOC118469558 n=1 Tax=Amphiprion ocellaris TaxID=80972 RepID=UPI00241118E4|nr:uncharacterized protein LOC118469558 [Amphiprion ocellaris]
MAKLTVHVCNFNSHIFHLIQIAFVCHREDRYEVVEKSSGESSEDEGPAAPPGEEPVTRGEQGTSEQQPVEEQSSGGEEPVTRDKKGTSKQQLGQKRGSGGARKVKRMWSTEEVKAVEKSLMEFIRIGKTPGKQACEKCIAASPEALADRDWKAVKFYVYNRIISDQRL